MIGTKSGTPGVWRRCGDGWVELTGTLLRPRQFGVVDAVQLDARHFYAFGGSIDTLRNEISAVLILVDGDTYREIEIPVPLSDVISIAGFSPNDLYVLGWNRIENGDARLYHVMNDLKECVRIEVDSAHRFEHLARVGSRVVALGCERPNLYEAPPPDCLRVARVDGPAVLLGDANAPRPLGAAVSVFNTDREMHVSTSPQTDAGALAGFRHHRVRCD